MPDHPTPARPTDDTGVRGGMPAPARRSATRLAPRAVGAMLLFLLVTALTPAAQAADTPAAGDGWIRAGHLAAGNGAADVRLTPFSGGETVTVSGVAYGDVTDYRSVEPGLYTVAVLPAGADMQTTPMVSTSVRVEQDSATSVFAIGEKGAINAQVLRDDLGAPSEGQARVRLLSAAPNGQEVSAEVVDGPLLAEGLTPGQATGYAGIGAQTWTVSVTTTDGETATGRVPVEAGGIRSEERRVGKECLL